MPFNVTISAEAQLDPDLGRKAASRMAGDFRLGDRRLPGMARARASGQLRPAPKRDGGLPRGRGRHRRLDRRRSASATPPHGRARQGSMRHGRPGPNSRASGPGPPRRLRSSSRAEDWTASATCTLEVSLASDCCRNSSGKTDRDHRHDTSDGELGKHTSRAHTRAYTCLS